MNAVIKLPYWLGSSFVCVQQKWWKWVKIKDIALTLSRNDTKQEEKSDEEAEAEESAKGRGKEKVIATEQVVMLIK